MTSLTSLTTLIGTAHAIRMGRDTSFSCPGVISPGDPRRLARSKLPFHHPFQVARATFAPVRSSVPRSTPLKGVDWNETARLEPAHSDDAEGYVCDANDDGRVNEPSEKWVQPAIFAWRSSADSSELVAPKGFRREDPPALPPILITYLNV